MGRPRVNADRVSSGYRVSPELHDRPVTAASERDVSVNWMITKAIEEFLSRLIPVNEIRWTRD